ncbi:hypothetical protein IRY61_02585 [Candidatus Saccharibacteria bacterium]|nr:hypothetical protein [Candidatus Saccharibacteria bacterium]
MQQELKQNPKDNREDEKQDRPMSDFGAFLFDMLVVMGRAQVEAMRKSQDQDHE